MVELAQAAAALAELQLRVVAAAGDAAAETGARDTGTWLASVTRADVPDAVPKPGWPKPWTGNGTGSEPRWLTVP